MGTDDNIARVIPSDDNIARVIPSDVNIAKLIPTNVNDDDIEAHLALLVQNDENSNESEEVLSDEDINVYAESEENDVKSVKFINQRQGRKNTKVGGRRERKNKKVGERQGRKSTKFGVRQERKNTRVGWRSERKNTKVGERRERKKTKIGGRNGSRGRHAGNTFEMENDSEDDFDADAAIDRVQSDVFDVDDTKFVNLFLKQKKRCRGRFCKKLKKLQRLRNRETATGRERDEEILDQEDSDEVNGMQLQRHGSRGRKRHHKRMRQNKSRVPKYCRYGKISGICCDGSSPTSDRTCADGSKPKCFQQECNSFSALDFFAKLFETTS